MIFITHQPTTRCPYYSAVFAGTRFFSPFSTLLPFRFRPFSIPVHLVWLRTSLGPANKSTLLPRGISVKKLVTSQVQAEFSLSVVHTPVASILVENERKK